MKKSLRDRLKENSTIPQSSILSESKIFKDKDSIPTAVPMINVALSGDVDLGLSPGILMIAAPSKHFKSGFTLLMAKSYLTKHKDAMVLFYDSEFGSPLSYFDSLDLPTDQVFHSPAVNIEILKQDIMAQLGDVEAADKLIIIIDSIGNLASLKEVEDAVNQKSVADMSRAKALASLWRMVTPHLTLKNIPLVAINHIYKDQSGGNPKYAKNIMSGGEKGYLAANDIWFIGREQEKDAAKELLGYHFKIKIEKSRLVKEGSVIPIFVSFTDGIQKWSGLYDLALELDIISKDGNGVAFNGEKFSRKDIEFSDDFWTNIFLATDFKVRLRNHFMLPEMKMKLFAEKTPVETETPPKKTRKKEETL